MQNINLLNFLPAPPKEYINAKILTILVGILVLVLLIMIGFQWVPTISQRVTLSKLQTTKQLLTKQLELTSKTMREQQARIDAIGAVKEEEEMPLAEQELLKLISKERMRGFSHYLYGLATAAPYEVWLSSIVLNTEGGKVSLVGNAVSPNFVPQFLHNLQEKKVFAGSSLGVLQITKQEKYVTFTIESVKNG